MDESHELTDVQLAVMGVLWDREEATVGQVHEALLGERGLAPTTVATLLSRLEKRGVVTHRSEGRQYVYRPLVSRGEVRQSMVGGLVDRLFGGNPARLISHLLGSTEVDPDDLARVKALIRERERDVEQADGR